MNILLKIAVIGSLLLMFSACSEDFIDREPIIGTTTENYYSSAESAEAAVNAAYASLQFELSPAGHFRWFWGDIMSDDSDKGGSGDNDVVALARLEGFEGPTNTDLLESEWSANYEGIYRANVALENLPDIEMDELLKARLLGEARFIRAYYHYTLVTMFGDVPLVDRVLAPSEYNQPRVPKSEVWTFIESDLQAAIAALWERSKYPTSELGRVTKGAARALLAKSYLWQERFADAREMTQAVINSGEYSLEPSYRAIFSTGGENGPGSVFEIQYMNASGGNWGRNNANEGTFSNIFQRARGQFEGFGFNLPTETFVADFMAEGFEDPRLRQTVFRVGEAMGDRGIFTLESTGYPHPYYAKKYFNNKSEEAPFGAVGPNGGTNDRVIRYADVLLMDAEAAYHTGDIAGAQSSLNKVRERARAGDANILPDITTSGSALLNAIYRERRLELGLEGHRFFDLVRTGRAAEVLGALGFKAGTHEVFPIPASQIQLSNGAMTQNPGY